MMPARAVKTGDVLVDDFDRGGRQKSLGGIGPTSCISNDKSTYYQLDLITISQETFAGNIFRTTMPSYEL